MLSSVLTPLIFAVAFQQTPVPSVQKSSGWCSPNIANVTGNVTVNCIGVDPRALTRLNAQLNRKNLELADKIREADEWTGRYKELEARLSEAGDDSVLSQQAEVYLHEGELEKAGATLDRILGREDKQTKRTAANHYNRALVFELQFRPLDALPHLRTAYVLAVANGSAPERVKYGIAYGSVLLDEDDFTQAEPIIQAVLKEERQLAVVDPATWQPKLAGTLNNLAILCGRTQRMKEAAVAYEEALEISRQLAKANPAEYQTDVAQMLNNLATLYEQGQRTKEAETDYMEALEIRRQLAKKNPAEYEPDVAETLNNLATLYEQGQRMKEAEAAYEEALEIRRRLAKTNPAAYQPYVANTLLNLGVLLWRTERMKESEVAYLESLDIFRELAKSNPARYQSHVADVLNDLAIVYGDTQRTEKAEPALWEELSIYRQLARTNPVAYEGDVATTLNNLAILSLETNNPTEAARYVEEALIINRERWKANPEFAGDDLARSLLIDTKVQQAAGARCQLAKEAVRVAQDPDLIASATEKTAACTSP